MPQVIEKIIFDEWIVTNNALEMYVFSQVALSTKFADLYHSFNKGKKGYYQDIVDDLIRKGKAEFEWYLVEFQNLGDIEPELSAMTYKLIESRAT